MIVTILVMKFIIDYDEVVYEPNWQAILRFQYLFFREEISRDSYCFFTTLPEGTQIFEARERSGVKFCLESYYPPFKVKFDVDDVGEYLIGADFAVIDDGSLKIGPSSVISACPVTD